MWVVALRPSVPPTAQFLGQLTLSWLAVVFPVLHPFPAEPLRDCKIQGRLQTPQSAQGRPRPTSSALISPDFQPFGLLSFLVLLSRPSPYPHLGPVQQALCMPGSACALLWALVTQLSCPPIPSGGRGSSSPAQRWLITGRTPGVVVHPIRSSTQEAEAGTPL